MPVESRRVKDLFVAALDQADVQARVEMLDRECGDDAELRQRVADLLAAHDAPHAALNKPLAAPDLTGAFEPQESAVGSVIAEKYKLLQEIGEGGMGSVYMADQLQPVKRRVAVKVIKAGMDSARVLARFEAERQALALMDHPNIAKVLDGGLMETKAQGRPSLGLRPFFVMELVKGIPLTQFCDQHKLPVLDRLHLFMQICSAVQHAHQKGIIHRDLKPTNILVESHDGKPVPKVIDFGLAKAMSGVPLTEHTLFTALGTVAGTPLYMAPEQAAFNAVDVDTRADVYALGVILYELLTGTTPIERETFKQAAFDEMLRMIREQEPVTPSSRLSSSDSKASVAAVRQMDPAKLGRYVKGELDWIVMKALSKERDRRYETANGFAKDVERFLNHEPVLAGPPSASYRLRKFAQRNRPQVIAAGMVLLALVAGIVGTSLGLLEARKQERLASERAEAETKERQRADAKTKEVQATLVVVGERTKLAQDAFGDMVFDMQTLLETRPGTQDLRRALLEKARQGLAKILEEARKQGTPDHTLVVSHHRMGVVEQQLGNTVAAQKEYQAGYELAQRLADADPENTGLQRDLSVSYQHLGDVTLQLGQTKDALDFYRNYNEIAQRLADADPKNAQAQRDLSLSFDRLGDVTSRLGQTKEALDFYRKDNEIAQKLADADPMNAKTQRDLSVSFNKLGDVTLLLGQTRDSLDFYRTSLDVRQRIADADPNNAQAQRDLGISFERLGGVTLQLGRTKDALDFYKKYNEIAQKIADADQKNAGLQRDLSFSFDRLGNVTLRLGQTKDALDFYRKSLDVRQRIADADPKNALAQRDLSLSYEQLGEVTLRLGQRMDALDFYRKSNEIAQKIADADPKNTLAKRNLSISFSKLGDVSLQLGQTKDALGFYRECSTILKRLADADRMNAQAQNDLSVSFSKLGDVTLQLGQTKDALDFYRKYNEIAQKVADADPMNAKLQHELSVSFGKLGEVTLQLGQTKDALDFHRKCSTILKRLADIDPENTHVLRDLSVSFNKLGDVTLRLGQTKDALDYYRKYNEISQKLADADPKNAQAQMGLFFSLHKLGGGEMANQEYDEAAVWLGKAEQALKDFQTKGWITTPEQRLGSGSVRQWQTDIAQRLQTCRKAEQALADIEFALKQPAAEVPGLLDIRVQVFAKKNDRNNLVATAAAYEKLATADDHHCYNAACAWSQASGVAKDDAKLREEYASKAMTLLRKSPTGKGYFVDSPAKLAAHMAKDTDLDPLRGREDFKKLLAELGAGQKKE